MTPEELRDFDKISVAMLSTAGIEATREIRRAMLNAAIRYRLESDFFSLPRSVADRDPLLQAHKAIAQLRSLKSDSFARYYLTRAIYCDSRCASATGDEEQDSTVDLEARFLGEHGRIPAVNAWDVALERLAGILHVASFLAAPHRKMRGDSKGMIAERWVVYRLALVWKESTGSAPAFSRATPTTKATSGRQVLKRSGFNRFALDFLKAVGATVGDEFACESWGELKQDGAEYGEQFDPTSDRSWRGLRRAVELSDVLLLGI